MCGMTHADVWHDSCRCVAWLMQMCGMTHADVRHASDAPATHVRATEPMPCPIHMCEMSPLYVWHDSFIWVTWFMHMCDTTRCVARNIRTCDMTDSYVRHDSGAPATRQQSPRLMHICNMTHSYVWHNSFICVTWHCMCDTTHLHARHASGAPTTQAHATRGPAALILLSHVSHMNESHHTYEWVVSHVCMSHVTHVNESCFGAPAIRPMRQSPYHERAATMQPASWVVSHIWKNHVTHMNEPCMHSYHNHCQQTHNAQGHVHLQVHIFTHEHIYTYVHIYTHM